MGIALVFFYLFRKGGGSSVLQFSFLGLSKDLSWVFVIFIFILLVGTTNAVNIVLYYHIIFLLENVLCGILSTTLVLGTFHPLSPLSPYATLKF